MAKNGKQPKSQQIVNPGFHTVNKFKFRVKD